MTADAVNVSLERKMSADLHVCMDFIKVSRRHSSYLEESALLGEEGIPQGLTDCLGRGVEEILLVLRGPSLEQQTLPEKTVAEEFFTMSALSFSFITEVIKIFLDLPFVADIAIKVLLVALHILCHFQFQLSLTPSLHAETMSLHLSGVPVPASVVHALLLCF